MSLINTVGGHNDQAFKVFRKFKAGEAITKGAPLNMSATADDGITVLECGADLPVVGVALTDASSGEYFRAQVKGFCEYILTDEGVTAGQLLIPGTDVADSVAIGSADAANILCGFGYALDADSSTVLSAAWIDCYGS